MAGRQSRFLRQQKIAAGFGFAIILAIVIYLASILITDIPIAGFVEGEHYYLIENPRRIRGDKTEIMEFFSYGCVHCYNLDDDLSDWVEVKGSQINFIRTPLISSELWRNYGRTYYTLQALDMLEKSHVRLFREIHGLRRNLDTREKITDLVLKGSDVSADEFKRVFNSPEVNQKVSRASQLARRFKIASVPNMIVNGKYLVRAGGTVGLSRMLDVMDYLIEKENTKPSEPEVQSGDSSFPQ